MDYIIKNPMNHLQQKDLIVLLGKTERQIRRYDSEGLPGHGQGRGRYYVWDEVRDWWVARASGSIAGDDGSDKSRKLRAEADMAEMESLKMAGNLLNRSEAILAWSAFLGRMKDNLLGYAGRVAPRLEDGMILAEREAVLNKEMHQVLRDVVAEVKKAAEEVDE